MAKSSKKQIYEDELKVIAELQKNAKESIESIAKRCDFSRQKVWRIIKGLKENKTIWGYAAIVNDEKINMNRYVMFIKKSVAKIDNAVEKIVKLIMQKKGEEIGVNIDYSLYLHGEYDWMLIFTAKDIRHAKRFSEILISQYSDVIKDVKLMETLFPVQKAGIINPEVEKLKEFL
jgi:DNA-binding Lrp family transcriptional regulator